MGITKEIWTNDIAEAIFPDNSFAARAIDESAFVDNAGMVHSPETGTIPTVVVGRTTLPATGMVQRTDVTVTYELDWHSTDPTVLTNAEELEVSYDKRTSIMYGHRMGIAESANKYLLWRWASKIPSTSFVRTSGVDRPAFLSGATGNRKKITLADFLAVKRIFDNQNIPQDGRVVVLPSEMYNDLLEDEKTVSTLFTGTANLTTGMVGQLYGFTIYCRSTTVAYSNAATPVLRSPTDTALTTANAAAIFWHDKFVKKAIGTINIHYTPNAAAYGNIVSVDAKAGGTARYQNGRGLVALIEASA